MPKISVVMPVYNTEKYVWEAIESILNQSFEDFEFIIIDDWSIDKSWEIIQKYAKKDNRIKAYQNEKNLWVVKTREKLHNKAKWKYIAIIDADDVALENRLELQFDFMQKYSDVAVLWWHTKLIDTNGKEFGIRKYETTKTWIKKNIFKKSPIAQPAVIIRKNVFEEVWGYNNNFERCQDYELRTRIFDKWYKILNLDKYLIKYRVFADQGKSKHLKLSMKNTIKIQSRYIFQKKYFSVTNIIYWFAECILFILPSCFVLWLFKKIEYKK